MLHRLDEERKRRVPNEIFLRTTRRLENGKTHPTSRHQEEAISSSQLGKVGRLPGANVDTHQMHLLQGHQENEMNLTTNHHQGDEGEIHKTFHLLAIEVTTSGGILMLHLLEDLENPLSGHVSETLIAHLLVAQSNRSDEIQTLRLLEEIANVKTLMHRLLAGRKSHQSLQDEETRRHAISHDGDREVRQDNGGPVGHLKLSENLKVLSKIHRLVPPG